MRAVVEGRWELLVNRLVGASAGRWGNKDGDEDAQQYTIAG